MGSLILDRDFTDSLLDPSTQEFQQLKMEIEQLVRYHFYVILFDIKIVYFVILSYLATQLQRYFQKKNHSY